MNKKDIKIVFFGTPDFAVESLRAILDNGFDVAAVVTATDKVAGRGHKIQCSAVKKFAEERGLRILQPEKLKDPAFIQELSEINADLFIVIAFRMLPEVVWAMPPLGTFNLHASLLPKYRGAAPINHAIINGETRTGVTTFFLQHEIDTGDIIDRVEVEILPEDNVGDLHDKLMALGAELTVKTIRQIVDGTLTTTPQAELIEEGVESCPAPKIFKSTCEIDWTKPVATVHNLVRGLSPYPGAWSELRSETSAPFEVKILQTRIESDAVSAEAIEPGTVLLQSGKMLVACGDGFIGILELQPAGKRRMTASEYQRGARLTNPHFVRQQTNSADKSL